MSLMINYQRNCEEVYIFVIVNEKNKIYFQINFWGKSNLRIRVFYFCTIPMFFETRKFSSMFDLFNCIDDNKTLIF